MEDKQKRNARQRRWRARNPERRRAYEAAYRELHRDERNKRLRESYARNREAHIAGVLRVHLAYKLEVLLHYGFNCACCGETEFDFLTVDHINNDGRAHRKKVGRGGSFYRWIVQHGFPSGLQVLCWNCNMGKFRNGGVCPHVRVLSLEERREARGV